MAGGKGGIRIEVPAEIAAWVKMFDKMPDTVAEIGQRYWTVATEVFFSATQEHVHVLSGDLKASGRSEVRRSAWWIIGEVSYGGGGVDYAVYEEARGGQHAFIARGWETSNDAFASMVQLIFRDSFEKGQ